MAPNDVNSNEPLVPGIELKAGPAAWRNYAGKMVAIRDGEIVVAGKTWAEGLAGLKAAGFALESVELMFVPSGAFVG